MNLPATLALVPIPGNIFSNSLWVAVFALVHVQIATFIVGATTIAIVSEIIFHANRDPRHEALARHLLHAITYVFGFGSALAIFWVMLIFMGLWGKFFVELDQITFWVFVFEAAFFVAEIVALYALYGNYEKLGRYGAARIGMMILLNIAFIVQMVLIDVVASYMLTPNGGSTNQLAQVLNPTDLPLDIHRLVGNIAWAGAVIALGGALSMLRSKRRLRKLGRTGGTAGLATHGVGAMSASEFPAGRQVSAAELKKRMEFADWAGHWGLLWAFGFTLLQPWIGYSYAKEIQLNAFPAWSDMMLGNLSGVFVIQICLLGLIFVFGSLYFRSRIARAGGSTRWATVWFVLLVLAWLLAIQPASLQIPGTETYLTAPFSLGLMFPFKIYALFGMVLFGLAAITTYLHQMGLRKVEWGEASRKGQALLLAFGLTVSVIMAVMGYIREDSRQPYLVEGEIHISGQQTIASAPPIQPRSASPQNASGT